MADAAPCRVSPSQLPGREGAPGGELVRLYGVCGVAKQDARAASLQAEVGSADEQCDRPRAQVIRQAVEEVGQAPIVSRRAAAVRRLVVLEQRAQERTVGDDNLEAAQLQGKDLRFAHGRRYRAVGSRQGIDGLAGAREAHLRTGDAIGQQLANGARKRSGIIKHANRKAEHVVGVIHRQVSRRSTARGRGRRAQWLSFGLARGSGTHRPPFPSASSSRASISSSCTCALCARSMSRC